MFANTPDDFTAAIDALRAKQAKQLQRLTVLADAHRAACELLTDWLSAAAGRSGRIWLSDEGGSLHISLGLSRNEIFADAEAHFCRTQDALRAGFPAAWFGGWSEVEDNSDAHEARRGAHLTMGPTDEICGWLSDGAAIWLNVYSTVSEDTACRVVQIGTKRVARYVDGEHEVPIYRALCPGDPMPVAAE